MLWFETAKLVVHRLCLFLIKMGEVLKPNMTKYTNGIEEEYIGFKLEMVQKKYT